VATHTQDQTLLCVLKTVATVATRTQDRTLLRVLMTVATVATWTQVSVFRSGPPPCSEDGGNSGDADPGSDPPTRSDDSGSSGDADTGSGPPLCSEDGSDSDDTGHGRSIVLTSTGKDPPLSLGLSLPLLPPLLTTAAKYAGA
jgi:hypothetical protein